MKQYIKSIVLLLLLFPLSIQASHLIVKIENHNEQNKLIIDMQGKEDIEPTIDEVGVAKVEIPNNYKGYATLFYRMFPRTIWLDGKEDITISFDANSYAKEISVEGALKEMNHYLNDAPLNQITIEDCKLDEESYMHRADSLYNENKKKLLAFNLPDNFTQIENNRLKYYSYANFALYPQFYIRFSNDTTYIPSLEYQNRLKEFIQLDNSSMLLKEARGLMTSAVSVLAQIEYPTVKPPIQRILNYVENNIENDLAKEHLVHQYVYSYLQQNGTHKAKPYLDQYFKNVTNEGKIAKMNALIDTWSTLEPGKSSPSFMATDINNKQVTLDDFKGKYVYIDVWATWCGPCLKEIPFLEKMEERYKDKDIYIVSLSTDADRKAWENKVKGDNKQGVQIILAEGDDFLEKYLIRGIPHFILLDKEGNIVDATMTRPSDPKTLDTLDKLLK